MLFSGGSFWQIFPLRGLTSENFDQLSLAGKIADYLWHITLPVTAMTLGAFATTTFLTKNSFLDEIRKQYVHDRAHEGPDRAARALWPCLPQRHADRRRRLSGRLHRAPFSPARCLIETIFSLDGLGLLSFESIVNRDYPVVFANLYIFALIGLVVNLLSDLTYMWIDPRIDFATREV